MQKEKNKKKNLLIWAIVALCISFVGFLISLYVQNSIVLNKYEIYTSLTIGETPAINLNSTGALTFGTLLRPSISQRTIFLENNYDFPIVYGFEVNGNISRFLVFEEKINLKSSENKTIVFSAIVPQNEEYAYYQGFLKVVVKKDI